MISVAMASYNGEKYIRKQLDSILNQTLKVDEIVIVDDQSVDQTVSVVKEIIKENPSISIQLFENPENVGYKKNFRNAMSHCQGDYVFLCDQDDYWEANKVETMIHIMESNEKIMALASSFSFIDQEDVPFEVEQVPGLSNNNLLRRVVEPGKLVEITFDEFCIQNSFQGCALCITKEMNSIFLNCFTDEIFHDWLLNLLASERQGMYFYNVPLFRYRIHGNNTIGINEQEHLNTKDRLKKTSTLHIRTEFAKQCVGSIKVLEKVDKDLLKYQPDCLKKKDFYEKHILYLEQGHPLKLLLQNKCPYYKIIKTNKARIMDIFIACKRKFFK